MAELETLGEDMDELEGLSVSAPPAAVAAPAQSVFSFPSAPATDVKVRHPESVAHRGAYEQLTVFFVASSCPSHTGE